MIYRILTDYSISPDEDIYINISIEKTDVEIHIFKSVVSDNCFINIKENGIQVLSGKICTCFEYIYKASRVKHNSILKGDFYFSYVTEDAFGKNFDYNYLGSKLFLFYDNKED